VLVKYAYLLNRSPHSTCCRHPSTFGSAVTDIYLVFVSVCLFRLSKTFLHYAGQQFSIKIIYLFKKKYTLLRSVCQQVIGSFRLHHFNCQIFGILFNTNQPSELDEVSFALLSYYLVPASPVVPLNFAV